MKYVYSSMGAVQEVFFRNGVNMARKLPLFRVKMLKQIFENHTEREGENFSCFL